LPGVRLSLPHRRPGAIAQLNDPGTFEEFLPNLESSDPLEFTDRISYRERLAKTKAETGETEAIVVGKGFVKGRPLIMGVMNPNFIMAQWAPSSRESRRRRERAASESLPLLMSRAAAERG